MSSRLTVALALLGLMWSPGSHARVSAPKALLIVGSAGPRAAASDKVVRHRIERLGYAVTLVGDRSLRIDAAADAALLVLSDSASLDVSDLRRLSTLPVPLVTWQPGAFHGLGLTGPTSGFEFGSRANETELLILNPWHPLAAGLTGRAPVVSVPSRFAWGLPGPEAITIAGLAQDTNLSVLFAYEESVEMARGRAPARRVALFGAAALTRQGHALLHAALRWAGTRNQPPRVSAGADVETTTDAPVILAGQVEDDGLPETGWLSVRWSLADGPAAVSFEDDARLTPEARFSEPGAYRLRLAAHDGILLAASEVTVTVREKPRAPAGRKPGPPRMLAPASGGTALLVVNSLTLTTGDTALKARLEALGYAVTTKTAASVQASDADNKNVVVITGSCVAADLGTRLQGVTTGVVVLRREIFPNMNMASTHGQIVGTQVSITTAGQTHPLGAGLSGTVTVTSTSPARYWATPPVTAIVAATIPGEPTQATSWGYEAGVTMINDFAAPGRRTGLFISNGGAAVLTTDGGKLFDAAADWTANTKPVANAGPDHGALVNTATPHSGASVTDDGLPNPPGAVSATWSVVSTPPGGAVTFSPDNQTLNPTMTFTVVGSYTLQLDPSDGQLSGTPDQVVINVASSNTGPTANAGPPQSVTLPDAATLSGSGSDDGLPYPPGTLTFAWSVVSAPAGGSVNFADPASATTTATFSTRGQYLVRLTASDGQLAAQSDASVTANGKVLLVTAGATSTTGEEAIRARLLEAELESTVLDAATVQSSDADDKLLVVIAPDAAAGTKFRDKDKPVIVLNPNILDDMKMTGTTAGADFGLTDNQSQAKVTILQGHALAGGLVGTPSIATNGAALGWGVPSVNAAKVASTVDVSSRITVFGYLQNATMVGLNAPQRRVGLMLGEGTLASLNGNGVALLDAAIAWSLGENTAPWVSAGSDRVGNVGTSLALSGTVADDGLPNPPAATTVAWSVVSAPGGGSVTFTPSATVTNPSASFSVPGAYVLRLAASDSVLTGQDDVAVTVGAAGANQTPIVDVGPDKAVTLPAGLTLQATVTDDGLPNPPNQVTATWSKVSGPLNGSVSFGTETTVISPSPVNPATVTTTATFTAPGSYVIRLSAGDTDLMGTDDLIVSVNSNALLLVGAVTPLAPADTVMKGRLEALNYTVVLQDAQSSTGGESAGKSVVILSPSCPNGALLDGQGNAKFRTSAAPVMVMTADLYSDMKLTGADEGTQRGIVEYQRRLTIVPGSETHPLAAGLSGTITVGDTPGNVFWGVPNLQNAYEIAHLEGNSSRYLIFGYPAGVLMVGYTPPSARVGFGLGQVVLADLNANGGALFDASIKWMTGSNFSPVVSAGPDQTVIYPNAATLAGSVSDDGRPNPPALTTAAWSQLGGPGTATFGNPSSASTTVTFSAPGTYILELQGNDGELQTTDVVVVTVEDAGIPNSPPTVGAGWDQVVPGQAQLHGTASDDGLPSGSLTTTWSQISGPGSVTFLPSSSALQPFASFSQAGAYVLRLTACDQGTPGNCTGLSASDDVTITTQGGRNALLVTGDGLLDDPDDVLAKARLESLGFTVTVVDETASASGSSAGKALVALSSSCDTVPLGTKYRTIAVPLITWEQVGYGDMAMTGTVGGTDFAAEPGQTQTVIATPTHPLAAGKTGTVTVTVDPVSMQWGKPGANAVKVATLVSDPTKATVFAYELGALMANGTTYAPARRVGLFVAARYLNLTGWDVFDAAVRWASAPRVPALFVIASGGTPNTAETALRRRLEGLGFAVTFKASSSSLASTDACQGPNDCQVALVLISGTVSDVNVTTKFKDSTVPVMSWRHTLHDDMKLAGTVSGTDFGLLGSQTQISIVDPAHAMAAGLSGNQAVYTSTSSLAWGKPTSSAVKVATTTGSANQATIFGYDLGATLFGGVETAQDRRVGFFLTGTSATLLTPAGTSLFDAAVAWATGGDPDGDGLTTFAEWQLGTNPRVADTNGDGIRDDIALGLGISATELDMDGDGVLNATEITNGTDPFDPNSDGDSANDGADCFPLDPTRWVCPTDPTPGVPPCVTLTEPTNATLVSIDPPGCP